MTVELISVTAVLAGGTALVFALGIRGCALPALGLVAGLALQIICGAIQVVTGLPTTPALTLALVVLLPAGLWIWSGRRNNGFAVPVKPVLAVLLLVVVVVIALYGAGLVNLTPDSYQYLSTGSLLESGHLDAAPPERLLERSLAVPLIHAPANLAGAFYLRSITPLLALAALLTLGWICREGLRVSLEDPRLIFSFSAAAVLWLLSSHRFVYHAFYVNGHLLSAVLLLLPAGCGWLYARGAALPPRALFIMQLLAIPALAVTRPEGSLLAGLALLPVLVSAKYPWKQRAALLLAWGLSTGAWHGFLWQKFIDAGQAAPEAVVYMSILGAAAIMAAPVLAWRQVERRSTGILILAETGLWLALVVMAAGKPRLLYRSALATIQNLALDSGGWGVFPVLLGALLVAVLAFTDIPDRVYLRFPVTAFIPLAFMLAYLREGSYRVGPGDSLNRMLLHIMPLAILLVVSAAASPYWGLPKKNRK